MTNKDLEPKVSISICIPQYNRVPFLLENLKQISKQKYEHIEIAISDDCSKDNTEAEISALKGSYKYPILYQRHSKNQGYDRNLRSSIEMSTGSYFIILGNDDTINPEYDLSALVSFIVDNNYPEIGFTNFLTANTMQLQTRAHVTGVLGYGPDVAFQNYSCFSFVAGIVMKKESFLKYNTARFDGSIYSQMYLATVIIASGGKLFSIREPVVIKDILPANEENRVSYIDHIPKKWRDFKLLDGGLHSVIHVIISAFIDAGKADQGVIYGVFKKTYRKTFPYWIVNYRKNKATPAAIGLIAGLRPDKSADFSKLSMSNKMKIYMIYMFSSIGGLMIPHALFDYLTIHYWRKSEPIKESDSSV